MAIPINELTLAIQSVCDPNDSDLDNFKRLCEHLVYRPSEIYESAKGVLDVAWDDAFNHIENKKDNPRYALGPVLRKLRLRNGMSVTELARKTGLSRGYLTRVEHQKHPVTSNVLNHYSKTFNYKIECIVGGIDVWNEGD